MDGNFTWNTTSDAPLFHLLPQPYCHSSHALSVLSLSKPSSRFLPSSYLNLGFHLHTFSLHSLILLFIIGLTVRYLGFYAHFHDVINSPNTNKTPPTLPHFLPLIGNAFAYIWNPRKFIDNTIKTFGGSSPVNISIAGKNIFMVMGPQNVQVLWRYSGLSTSTKMYEFALRQVFGMPRPAARRVVLDDSGFLKQPHPESNVEFRNRVDYHVHHSLATFLSGVGLDPLLKRFETFLAEHLESLDMGDEWQEHDDFWTFITDAITPAIIKAICGPYLVDAKPNFCRDLWTFTKGMPTLVKGIPRFLSPGPYRVRDSLIRDIWDWHKYARENHDESKVDEERDYDPYWGCKFMKERQTLFRSMDDFDSEGVAAGDLGAIFGASSNAITCAFWSCYETFRNPTLLSHVRREATTAQLPHSPEPITSPSTPIKAPSFSVKNLITLPRIQSIFAETLRLRMSLFIVRYTKRDSITLGNWRLPKNRVIFVPTSAAHMNTEVWNEGPHNEYPVREFWSDRFLIYDNDPASGPKRRSPPPSSSSSSSTTTTTPPKQSENTRTENEENSQPEPKFSMEGMYSSWIPFGGGVRSCPGRHFSKRQIILIIAMMISAFDVEFGNGDEVVDVGGYDFGVGAEKPKGKVPFRIRRRRG